MLLLPDPTTAVVDPFRTHKTLNMTFFVHDPLTGEPYSRDPRNIAKKAEEYLRGSGIADTAYFGPEAEFYIFDSARFATSPNGATTTSTRSRAPGTPGARRRAATSPTSRATRAATSRSRPTDHFADLRVRDGQQADRLRHRRRDAAPRGRHRRPGRDQLQVRTLLQMADKLMLFKYIVKNVAWAAGKTVTFMPKPLFGDNGSGMHCHQSLWKDGEPLFYDEVGYAGLSDMARYYIGGLLKHAPSLLAFTNPTVNSYHRLVPGFEAPVNLVYSPAQPLGLRPDPDHRRRARRPSASSSACPTRRATRTSRSPRC